MNFFQSLRNENFDVIAVQETHCDNNSLSTWKDEWGGASVWTHYASDQAGVAILFSPKRNVNILRHSACNEGRILTVTAEIESCIFQFANVYGPNPTSLLESNAFFSQINLLLDESIQPIILGDFNMVENPNIDRSGGTPKKRQTYGHLRC